MAKKKAAQVEPTDSQILDDHINGLMEPDDDVSDQDLAPNSQQSDDNQEVTHQQVYDLHDELESAEEGEFDGQEQQTQDQQTQDQQTQDQQTQDQQEPSMVPHQALHEERTRRQELMQQNQVLQQRMDQMLQMMQQNQQSQSPQQPQGPQPPQQSPEEDPIGWIEYQNNVIRDLQEQRQQEISQQAHQNEVSQAIQIGNAQAQQFRAQTPDYDDAYAYMSNFRQNQLSSMGLQPHQIQSQMQQEMMQGMMYALQNGINPGQMLYNVAINSGYQKKQSTSDEQQNAPQRAAAQPQPQQRVNSLGQSPGNTRVEANSAADLARMTDREFDSWLEKYGDEGLARAMGLQGVPD